MALTADRSLLAKLREEVTSRAESYGTDEWWHAPGAGILVIVCDQITHPNCNTKPTFMATDHMFFALADLFAI